VIFHVPRIKSSIMNDGYRRLYSGDRIDGRCGLIVFIVRDLDIKSWILSQ
jgi:hypothetical protein